MNNLALNLRARSWILSACFIFITLGRNVVESTFSLPISRRNFVDQASFISSTMALQGGYTSDVNSSGNFWNRETSREGEYSGKIVKEAKIICLSDPADPDNERLYSDDLPQGSKVVAIGSSIVDFDILTLREQQPNVVFVSHPKVREVLVQLLDNLPSLEWVHTRSAGIDFIASNGLASANVLVTNAKGMYSSTLAEYTMMAISYFAKDLPRLMKQKEEKNWNKYPIEEIRGKTLGIVGYGDIGRAAAKLAKAYGMKVIALRKKTKLSQFDPYCDEVFGGDKLNSLVERSDYVLVAAPLTPETKGLINAEVISHAKSSAVIINVGRGPIIVEADLIEALESSKIKGAALDVTEVEPCPKDSRLWTLDNVLLSPHNMDMTTTFMKESTDFFINENLPRYLRGIELLNPVDKAKGY